MSGVKKLDVTVNLWQGEAVIHKERLRDRMTEGGGGEDGPRLSPSCKSGRWSFKPWGCRGGGGGA